MNSSATQTDAKSVYREGLQQAIRVLQALPEQQRVNNFNISIYAIRSGVGVIACIAGHCGLDPWFQERGFVTAIGESMGSVSVLPEDFFGTARPFHRRHYPDYETVTVDDAIQALDDSIAILECNSSEVDG